MVRSQVKVPGRAPWRQVLMMSCRPGNRISGTRISTIRSASVRLRIRGGSMRMTRSRVIDAGRPRARTASARRGRASSMPSIRPSASIPVTRRGKRGGSRSRGAPTAGGRAGCRIRWRPAPPARPRGQRAPEGGAVAAGVSTPAAGRPALAPMGTPPAGPWPASSRDRAGCRPMVCATAAAADAGLHRFVDHQQPAALGAELAAAGGVRRPDAAFAPAPPRADHPHRAPASPRAPHIDLVVRHLDDRRARTRPAANPAGGRQPPACARARTSPW